MCTVSTCKLRDCPPQAGAKSGLSPEEAEYRRSNQLPVNVHLPIDRGDDRSMGDDHGSLDFASNQTLTVGSIGHVVDGGQVGGLVAAAVLDTRWVGDQSICQSLTLPMVCDVLRCLDSFLG
jgi:hypothetical protein